MKTKLLQTGWLLMAAALLLLSALASSAQDFTGTANAVPQLGYAASQVLQLEQAKIGDAAIIAYIKSTGNSYRLNADQIIYLRQQGVSDAVLTAMLSQTAPTTYPVAEPMPATPAPEPVPDSVVADAGGDYVPAPDYYDTGYTPPCYYNSGCGWSYPIIAYGYSGGGYWRGGAWRGGSWRGGYTSRSTASLGWHGGSVGVRHFSGGGGFHPSGGFHAAGFASHASGGFHGSGGFHAGGGGSGRHR